MEKLDNGNIVLTEEEYKSFMKSAQIVGFADGVKYVLEDIEKSTLSSFEQAKANLLNTTARIKEKLNILKKGK